MASEPSISVLRLTNGVDMISLHLLPPLWRMSAHQRTFEGKTVIVTGSSRGVGAEVARDLGRQGANVVVNYVSDASELLAADVVQAIVAAGSKAIAVQADTSTVPGGQILVDAALEAYGQIDILVLNAAKAAAVPLATMEVADYDLQFDTNVKGPLFLVKAAAPYLPRRMFPREAGSFFISSVWVITPETPSTAMLYTASKGALEQISRLLAKDPDIGGKGITVNTLALGAVDTDMLRRNAAHILQQLAEKVPTKRIGEVGDIAPVVAFIASPAAQWVNAQTVQVNGGWA
ncbi:hypothetical protein MIND_00202000 [Mycena indigotica]|uniref:NAD(P)-binding protein n=1 Tax=Mycena indigotica TaxID=2126181 RepID=A0A8H6T807_9AGAR|nr:uncharacterized protein MIND_00202000 [Mycena indigotica]KAF7311906.1 hypothetical protein MIND_00202000 [Mycena indigotica]